MTTIGVAPRISSAGLKRTLDALGSIFNVRFEGRPIGNDAGIDAWLILDADQESLCGHDGMHCPFYAVISTAQHVLCGESAHIEFAENSDLLSVFSGRRVTADEAVSIKALPGWLQSIKILASKEEAPIWAMTEVGGNSLHYVSLPIPELEEGEPLFQYFHGRQFLRLLPLFCFLRSLTGDRQWVQPPLQACFMIDDPNLHWRTYGFADFARIAADALVHHYHVSFATIPLDTWFFHGPTARLFQQHRDQISLLIHGNDHVADELARYCSHDECNGNLSQGLKRIDAFEKRSGVEVSRVMAPPHGACAEHALAVMAGLGYEAASISRGSLRHHNPGASWLPTLGMGPSDIIGGLTVFPRFPFAAGYNGILIAALLRQPIIPMGHHNDLADGLHLFADLAGYTNSLGAVRWTDMRRISRSHFARRIDGRTLRVRMYSGYVEVPVPAGTTEIWVERPHSEGATSVPLAWKVSGDGTQWTMLLPDQTMTVSQGQRVEIASFPVRSPQNSIEENGRPRLWPLVRRQLTEVRDRLAPLVKRSSHSIPACKSPIGTYK